MAPHRLRCFGGILRIQESDGPRYVIVQGRHTGIWSFPKGHAYPEENPLHCARREIHEETGIELHEEPVHRIRLKGGLYYLFDLSTPPAFSPKDMVEICDVRWASVSELMSLPINSGLKDYLHRFL